MSVLERYVCTRDITVLEREMYVLERLSAFERYICIRKMSVLERCLY